jgi:hypothetical protein
MIISININYLKIQTLLQLNNNNKIINNSWGEKEIVFSYFNDELYIGNNTNYDLLSINMSDINSSSINNYMDKYGRGEFSGRLFIDEKILTFWYFPKNNKQLKKIVNDLEEKTKLNIWNDEWKIEYNKIENDEYDWGNWNPMDDENIEYIPIKNYKKLGKRSEKELKTPHLMTPIEKEKYFKTHKIKGFGSDKQGNKVKGVKSTTSKNLDMTPAEWKWYHKQESLKNKFKLK